MLLHPADGNTAARQRHWIAADARVDGRSELIKQLEARGRFALQGATDAELIVHAYDEWGDECVHHLAGDFAFAIRDTTQHRLFCARDRLGVKPFYYAQTPTGVVFSTALESLRRSPGVSSRLNNDAVGDFLLFGANENWATTTFADIQRLPPAHTLTCERDTVCVRRYWAPPADGAIRYRRQEEYVEHFNELFGRCVSDRMRDDAVGVWLSGGIDSSAVAATAQQLAAAAHRRSVHAHTVVYDSLIADDTRQRAADTARSLGIEPTFFVADHHRAFAGWDDPAFRTSEPCDDPFWTMRRQQLAQSAARARVWLSGEGADEVLWPSAVVDTVGHMPWSELGAGVLQSLAVNRRRPAVGLRRKLRQWRGRAAAAPPLPRWLNQQFAEGCGLHDRWRQAHADANTRHHHLRPEAARRLATSPWPWYFETFDAGETGVPVEARYPFLDVRLVEYLLSLPPFPWFVDKHVLRRAMRDSLPSVVLRRPKQPLAGCPLRARLRLGDMSSATAVGEELDEYVDRAVLPPIASLHESDDCWRDVRPLCLHHWLRYYERTKKAGASGASSASGASGASGRVLLVFRFSFYKEP
jgi:asparagine synthase (glutamine-hydrolysing)